MRQSVAAALLTLIFCAPSARAASAASENWDARLIEAKGDVTISVAGEEKSLPVEKGLPLDEGDVIATGADGGVDICLEGGGLIHLAAGSQLDLAALKRSQTEFKLNAGTFLAKIQKLQPAQSMLIKTPSAIASIKGTDLGVEVDPKNPDESHVGVFDEGKVEVRGQGAGSESIIGGQETEVLKGEAPLHAYELQRLVKHRGYMRTTLRQHLAKAKAGWKKLSAAQRKDLRQKTLARLRDKRSKMKEAGKAEVEARDKKAKRKKALDAEAERKRKKMEEFRNKIRQGQK